MYKLKQEKSFIKDLQKHRLNDNELFHFSKYVSLLCEGKSLPQVANDHALKGEYLGFREFHIGGDMLVIYKIIDDVLYLTRLGTHAQLFKNK